METLAGPQGSNVLEAECSKVARVEDQIDVHTRLPLLKAKQEQKQPNFTYRTVPRAILEVFSVRFLEFEHHDLKQMYGCILISALPTYVVFSRKDGDPLYINSEGFVKLRGPDRVIEPSDCIFTVPHLFRYQACADQFKDNKDEVMMNTILDDSYDTVLSRRVRSQFGQIEVNYAVYKHGLEARVDITLIGCQFPSATTVHGLITAQNSKLGEKGKSILFDRDDGEGISIDVSPCKDRIAQLPLARCKTAVPVGSFLTIYVNIWQNSIIGAPDQPIVENKNYEFTARLGDREVKTFRGAACQVNVGVTWPETAEYGNGQQGFYA